MKVIGGILIAIGIALLLFIGYNVITEENQIKSPIPDSNGIKVIFVTPQSDE